MAKKKPKPKKLHAMILHEGGHHEIEMPDGQKLNLGHGVFRYPPAATKTAYRLGQEYDLTADEIAAIKEYFKGRNLWVCVMKMEVL